MNFEVQQTEICPVPESWKVVPLGEIAKIERGKFSHRPRNEPRFYGGEYPFVQTGDVANCGGYVRTYKQTLNKDGLAISKMFPSGTILITIAANIGFTGILEFDCACPDSLIGISPSDRIQNEYLNFYLMTQQPEMDRLAPKGTQKNINIQFLKPWPVPLPPLPEQKKIAHVLSMVQRAIEAQERIIQTTTELKKALMHKLFTEGLRNEPQKQTEIGPIPESWEIKTVGDYCDLLNGYAFKSENYVTRGGIPNFRVVNINWDGTVSMDDCKFLPESFADSHQKYLLREGDILFVMVGATRGKLAQIPASILPALMNQNMWRIVPNCHGIDRDYLFFHLLRSIVRLLKENEDQARGFFKKSDFKNIPLVIPTEEEQIEIRTVFQIVDAKLGEHATMASRLKELFSTLLHELMTAKVRVHELDLVGA